jgi:YD repeat-containing protein
MHRKRIAIGILLFSACLGAYPYGDAEVGKVTWRDLSLNGQVRSLRIEHVVYVEKSGQWTERERKPSYSYTFDRGGKQIEYINFFALTDTAHAFRVLCVFDSKGKLTEELHYKADGTLWRRFVRSYDGQGNLMEWAVYDTETLSAKSSCKYDNAGKLLGTTCFDAHGNTSGRTVYSYDSRGNRIEEGQYNDKEKLLIKTFWSYDNEGNIIEEDKYNAAGALQQKTAFLYDGEGKRANKILFSRNIFDDTLFTVYAYDSRGRNIRSDTYKDNGALQERTTKLYNSGGYLTEQDDYAADGTLKKKIVKAYDGKGRLSQQTDFLSNGTVQLRTVYRYDDSGNQTAWERFSAEGILIDKTVFMYDSKANWIEKVYSKSGIKLGTIYLEPIGADYRIFEYYD